MERKQVQYAVAVIEAGSFTEAARRLGVSQPTVSNAVARLEEALGLPLLVRSSRRIALTEFGAHVLPAMRRVLQAEADLLDEIERYRHPERARVRIGLSPIVDLGLVHAPLAGFRTHWPGAELVFKECSLGDLGTRLAEGSLDAALSVDVPPHPGQGRVLLYEERLRYVPPGGAEGPRTVSLSAVAARPLVLSVDLCGLADHTLRLLQSAGLRPELYPGRAMSYEVLVQWAELGMGGALVPESKLGSATRYPLLLGSDGSPAKLEIEAVWRRDLAKRPHLAAFVHHLVHRVRPLIAGASVPRDAALLQL
jgi:DNA-binding transcriptional LysR family regulator